MILIQRKGMFKTALVILEDDKVDGLVQSGAYSCIRFMSYTDMKKSGFVKTSKTTALVDLTRDREAILAGFNDTTRNEIRRTEKLDGFRVETKESADDHSYELYRDFELLQKRSPQPMRALEGSRAWLAYYNDEIISGIYVIEGGKYLRIRSIFSRRLKTDDKELYKIIGYATRRLVYEICLWGKDHGCLSLDMASVNLESEKTGSIARFKMSFGGTLVPEFTYTYKSKMFAALEWLGTLRALLRRWAARLTQR